MSRQDRTFFRQYQSLPRAVQAQMMRVARALDGASAAQADEYAAILARHPFDPEAAAAWATRVLDARTRART